MDERNKLETLIRIFNNTDLYMDRLYERIVISELYQEDAIEEINKLAYAYILSLNVLGIINNNTKNNYVFQYRYSNIEAIEKLLKDNNILGEPRIRKDKE